MRDHYLALSLIMFVVVLVRPGLTAQPDEIITLDPPSVDAEPTLEVADEPSLEVLDPLPTATGESYPRLRRFMPQRFASWYFQADALALRRDVSSDLPMAALAQANWQKIENPTYNEDTDPPEEEYMWAGTISSSINLTVDEASLNSFRAGGRLLLGRSLGRNSVMEVSYFDLAEWRGTTAISNNVPLVVKAKKYGNSSGAFEPTLTLSGSLVSPLSNFGNNWLDSIENNLCEEDFIFDGNNVAEIRYASRLDNLEWNLRHWIFRDPRFLQVSLLIGGRYMNVDETFFYHTERNIDGTFTPYEGATLGSATTSITTDTRNPMVGIQLGGTYEAYLAPGWWLDCRLKIALMNNDARQTTFFTHQADDAYDGWHQSEANNSRIASAVDATIGTKIYFNRHLAVDISYQLLYLNGLALASDNFNADPDLLRHGTAPINVGSDALYHGMRLGVSCAW